MVCDNKAEYDLSISIVSYNNGNDIRSFLKTLLRYTSLKLKFIVYVINNSQTQRIDDLEKLDSRIVVIQMNKNVGFGAGHNAVLNKINSKYHAIVNPDIILNSDSFSELVHFLNTHDDVGMVAPLILGMDGKTQNVYRRELTLFDLFVRYVCPKLFKRRLQYHILADQDKTKDFCCPFVQGSFLVLKTNLFKELNGFDDRYFMYAEDADLCKRVSEKQKIMVHPEAKVFHKWEQESHRNLKLTRIHTISLLKYFKKWGWKIA